MTTGLFFLALGLALAALYVVHRTLAGRRLSHGEQDARLRLLSNIATLEEVQQELFQRKTLAAMGELAGGVSHDLRTPLAVINNSTHILRSSLDGSDAGQQRCLDQIEEQTRRATEIISNLLDFSSTAKTEPEVLAVTAILDTLIAEFDTPDGVLIRRRTGGEPGSVRIATSQLRQVVHNILSNAVQAMDGAGTIDIGAVVVDGRAKISITNAGEPIPPDKIDKIFTPLFSTKATGTGLGLSIAKNLMEANGGRISVSSSTAGTTFVLDLPDHSVDPTTPPDAAAFPDGGATPGHPR